MSFHAQWKVRTVIWDFANERLPDDLSADLARVGDRLRANGELAQHFRGLLDRFEVDAVRARIDHLLAVGALPEPDEGYHCYPWPMV